MNPSLEKLVEQFQGRVDELRRAPLTRIRYTLRDAVLPKSGAPCWHCAAPARHVETLVPERAGGPVRLGNLIAACGPCREFRGDLDVLEFAEEQRRVLTTEQKMDRERALMLTPHALPSKAQRTKQARIDYLRGTRWTQARVPVAFMVTDHGVLVSPCQVRAASYAGALVRMLRDIGGELVADGVVCVANGEWDRVAVALVERHGVLRPLP